MWCFFTPVGRLTTDQRLPLGYTQWRADVAGPQDHERRVVELVHLERRRQHEQQSHRLLLDDLLDIEIRHRADRCIPLPDEEFETGDRIVLTPEAKNDREWTCARNREWPPPTVE